MKNFSCRFREAIVPRLNENTEIYDLVIIGGGITGAGVARDAASRGMKVILVESGDFASGTSSRSSKLIHGGLRYLEKKEFGLVFEALLERRRLFEMAPHLVHPLRFSLPLYEGSRVGMFKMGLGMWLYDLLALFEMPERHEKLSRMETLSRNPLLARKGLLGSYVYSDAYMDDDRLVIETLRSAVNMGAICLNHIKAIGATQTEGKITSVKCKDQISGEILNLKAKHFVSTVGPWTDLVATDLLGNWKKIMRPSKGVHLTFSRESLPLKEAVVMVSDDEKRIVFGIPRDEMVIVGTTDTDYKDSLEDVHTNFGDVQYLLNVIEEYFPGANLTEKDIISSYAGIRPLVDDGSASESGTSREHLIVSDPRNITFVAGGKYTTYRKMAEQAVTTLLESFNLEQQVQFARNNTIAPINSKITSERLERAFSNVAHYAKNTGWSEAHIRFMVRRHGPEIERLFDFEQPGDKEIGPWALEARFAIHETMCLNLVDFYLRRSHLFLSEKDHGWSLRSSLLTVFAEEINWSESEKKKQLEMLEQHLKRELGWRSHKE